LIKAVIWELLVWQQGRWQEAKDHLEDVGREREESNVGFKSWKNRRKMTSEIEL